MWCAWRFCFTSRRYGGCWAGEFFWANALPGAAWLLYGPLGSSVIDLATDYDARWQGESTYTYLGTAATIVGDSNGDGFDDIVLNSVFGDEGSATDRGAVWLFLGG